MDDLLDLHSYVWHCPYKACGWSLLAEAGTQHDVLGIEAALADHMDTDHAGWTLASIRSYLAAYPSEGDSA